MQDHRPRDPSFLRRMMECSELRISMIAQMEDGHAQQAAARVLESTHAYREWETTHSQLLRGIADQKRLARQIDAVKRSALSMIHRKAPFEYLRDQQVSGRERHRFFRVLYGEHDFARAVVREHRQYLTSFCSYICIDQFCGEGTLQSIRRYERLYTSYWQANTRSRLLEKTGSPQAAAAELLQYLRDEVEDARLRVLERQPNRADALTIEELRHPTGDTVRLRAQTPLTMY